MATTKGAPAEEGMNPGPLRPSQPGSQPLYPCVSPHIEPDLSKKLHCFHIHISFDTEHAESEPVRIRVCACVRARTCVCVFLFPFAYTNQSTSGSLDLHLHSLLIFFSH